MAVTGIIAEFDPFHGGHRHLISRARCLVPGTGIVCVMSGNFTQRGAPACADKLARARAAVENGADLVFELPVSRAMASAPAFGRGGVELLAAAGCITHLAFGSECGDPEALRLAADGANSPDFSEKLRKFTSSGMTYAAAFAAACPPEAAEILSNPNDLLAVEYIRALDRFCPGVVPVPVKRVGAAHGSKADGGIFSSASRVRELALSGVMPGELPLPENVREILEAERERGAFPFDPGKLDAAVLGVICRMGEDAVALTPDGGDGLASRVCRFAKTAVTAEELCQKAKSRNFTLARVRRCVWQAFLGITREDQARSPQYLRLLAVGENGREILREMELTASVPVITKPAMLNRLSGEGEKDAALEARADSLRSLALPQREDMMKKSPFVKKSAQQSL